MITKKHVVRRIISILLSISMLASLLTGCGSSTGKTNSNLSQEEIQTIVDETSKNISNNIEDYIVTDEGKKPTPITVSYSWEDYVGDVDTLVYGLIASEYELFYDVFAAEVELSDGTKVYGIGYTDYADYYAKEDGGGYFPAGFISFIGEPDVPQDEREKGLAIVDLDYDYSDYGFVLAYDTDAYLQHCVVWDTYLQYGIDEAGKVTYSVAEYERGTCNEQLGALYSYDEDRFVFDTVMGGYKPISGTTLSETMDFDSLEQEVNRILEEQDFNFSKVEVESAAYFSQEAVTSYLLSLQEETFMGYQVSELVAYAETINPMECIRITPEGAVLIDVQEGLPDEPEEFTKWLVGIGCGIVIVSSVALDVFVPAMRPASGAISGAAFEVFMQVVVENHELENVNWGKVAVSATSGAMLAWACPLVAQNVSSGIVNIMGNKVATEAVAKLAGYTTLTFSNALVSGTTSTVFSIMDNKSDEEVFDAFLIGASLGGACTIFSSALSEVGNAAMNALTKTHPNNWLVKATETVETYIGKHQIHLSNNGLENILAPKSVYEATKCAINEIQRQMSPERVLKAKIKELPADNNKDLIKLDADGNVITKAQLKQNGGNCIIKPTADCDPEILEAFRQCNITEIVVKDGVPDFSSISSYTFIPTEGIGPNRETNMKKYYDQLADEWIENNFEKMPQRISDVLTDVQKENLNGTIVQEALSKAGLTPHEGTDGVVYLVDRLIHNKTGHYGGVALAKEMARLELGMTYVKDLAYSATSSITGTLISEGVSSSD